MITDQHILNRLKSILGSLYDLDKEDMYLRVVRIVQESNSLHRPYEPVFPSFSQKEFAESRTMGSYFGWRLSYGKS